MADLLELLGVSAPAITPTAPAGAPAAAPAPAAAKTPAQDPLLALVGAPSAAPASPSGQASAASAPAPAPPPQGRGFGAQLGDAIADVPHQLGLTTRYAIEGVGDGLDFLASPIRAGLNAILPNRAPSLSGLVSGARPQPAITGRSGQVVADALHLPTPQNATERVVGDASRMVAGAMVPVGLARGAGAAADAVLASRAQAAANGAAPVASGALRATVPIAQTMAANPSMQAISGAAAGGAGGYTRETGGTPAAQTVASLVAGVAAPMAASGLQRLGGATRSIVQNIASPTLGPAQIDVQISKALQDSGMTMADLPMNVQNGIRSDVTQALKSNDVLSPDAIRRLADYRLTGTTPTAATLTLDPAMVSQQKNLAKLGINSKDVAAQALGRVENANNQQLVAGMNELGASTADDALAGGAKVMDALSQRNARAQSLINDRYAAARAADGRSAALDPQAFTSSANDVLDQALLGGKLPADVRALLNKTATGEMPLTVDVAEQFKTRLGDAARDAAASGDKSQAKALGMVRSALDNTPLLPGQEMGQEAINAFNKARGMNRAWMGIVDKTPALQAVRDGIEPDKFVQQFIIGGGPKSNVMDVAMLKNSIKGSPEAMTAVRNQIAAYLKKAALNGAADEVGNFSQSAYNKALGAVGDRKLQLFFPPDDVNQLKAIGRVASYEQFQPRGAAVGNSNTAGTAMAAVLDRIGNSPLLSKIPFGKSLAEPAQNISIGIRSGRAMNAPAALGAMPLPPTAGPKPLLLSPALLMGQPDEQKKGLFFP